MMYNYEGWHPCCYRFGQDFYDFGLGEFEPFEDYRDYSIDEYDDWDDEADWY